MRKLLIFVSSLLCLNAQSSDLFIPKQLPTNEPAPLYVVLHGCLQNARDFTTVTRFNKLAEEHGFLVLYPEQNRSRNGAMCWNWFDPKNQGRSGEAQIIISEIERVKQQHRVNDAKIYLIGFSAGGGLASILAHCYPEYFAGLAIHSGISYKATENPGDAFGTMNMGSKIPIKDATAKGFECGGKRQRPPLPVIVMHGDKDKIVTPKFSAQLIEQFTLLNDYYDDGISNQSFTLKNEKTASGTTPAGYHYAMSQWTDQNISLVQVSVKELGHAWSGGPQQSYSDPKGPDATNIVWRFFNNQFEL